MARLFVTPPLSEIAKKLGKMLKYTPHFQSAFGTAATHTPTLSLSLSLSIPLYLSTHPLYLATLYSLHTLPLSLFFLSIPLYLSTHSLSLHTLSISLHSTVYTDAHSLSLSLSLFLAFFPCTFSVSVILSGYQLSQ